MSEVVQAWGLAFLATGGAWSLVMLLGLIATPRDLMRARVLLGTFTILGLVLTSVGLMAYL